MLKTKLKNRGLQCHIALMLGIVSNICLFLPKASSATNIFEPEFSNSENFLVDSLDVDAGAVFNLKVATYQDGLCTGTFRHTVGDVSFGYDVTSGTLDFSLRLSPGSQLLLGSKVRVAMIRAVVADYKINPPYGPHIREPGYDFHGRIYRYNRFGSKASFNIRRGDKVSFLWIASGTNPRVLVTRAVSCKIP